ncbi:hypothetical protein BH18VER2_BH18VER2_07190 [soil metagenome]
MKRTLVIHSRIPRPAVIPLWCTFLWLLGGAAYAGSATWKLNPTDNNWATATNWSPETVPDGTTDIATFGVSNTTGITVGDAPNGTNASHPVGEIVFAPGASGYTITMAAVFDVVFATDLQFLGKGISNNSGIVQNFVAATSGTEKGSSRIFFENSSSAGENTVFTNEGGGFSEFDGRYGGFTQFYDTSTAGSATFINHGGEVAEAIGGSIFVTEFSAADNATFINNAGEVPGAFAGYTSVSSFASLGSSTFIANPAEVRGAGGGFVLYNSGALEGASFIANGAAVPGAEEGQIYYFGGSGYATFTGHGGQGSRTEGGLIDLYALPVSGQTVVIAEGGTDGGGGGRIKIEGAAAINRAQFRVYGNGVLDLRTAAAPGPLIGSLEGDGVVSLTSNALSVGDNHLSTTFAGTIEGTGALFKVGNGTLTLSGANLYTGGTTVSQGTLVLTTQNGSATGTGAVMVEAGTLGGSGIISGAVTIGTGSGTGAFLAPAHGGNKQLTLTIQGRLTFNSDATYTYSFKAKRNKSKTDKVVANGVTINSGASINLSGQTQGTLTQGTLYPVITNTAATPIAGTFSNLPDGGIVNVNGNNLQASYEGGDGNDLTLTVVP